VKLHQEVQPRAEKMAPNPKSQNFGVALILREAVKNKTLGPKIAQREKTGA